MATKKPAPKGKGLLSKPPAKNSPYLTKQQNKLVNQQRASDTRLGRQQGRAVDQAIGNMENPFDYSGFQAPTGPDFSNIAAQFNPQDWNNWRQEQLQAANQDFENQFGDQFRQQRDEFEQMAYERGWSPGSKVYDQEKAKLLQSQNNQRQSNSLQAMNQAASNATQFGGLAMQARAGDIQNQQNIYQGNWGAYNNNVSDAMGRRYQPLQEANMLRSAQSPLMMSDATQANNMQLGNQQGQFSLAAKRIGGGGSAPAWQTNGFTSYQQAAAFEDARRIALMQQQAQLGPSQPSPWWALAGTAVGAAFS